MTDGAPDVSGEAEAAAGWWADVLRGEPTFSNGDAFAGALASAISDRRDDVPEDQIQAFEAELQSLVENRLTDMLQKSSDYTMYLNTDYSPMGELAEAAADAGIDAGMTAFPWKTGMWIEPGTVKVSDSSGNPSDEDGRAVIYPEPDAGPDPVTDGGGEPKIIAPEKEPELVGAHSAVDDPRCREWLEAHADGRCGLAATHTVVLFTGKDLIEMPRCDDCGHPEEVEDWDREWSVTRDPDPVTDGGGLREVCTECGWSETWPGGSATDDPAIAHAAATGHTVRTELVDDPDPVTDGGPDHDVPVSEQLTDRQQALVEDNGGSDNE